MIFSYSNRSKTRHGSWETLPDLHVETADTTETDVVVVGAGVSGLTAAVRCAQLGMQVIVVDKRTEDVPHGKYVGVFPPEASPELFAKHWLRACGSRINEDILWMFIRNSAASLDWLLSLTNGEVEAIRCKSIYRSLGTNAYPGDYELCAKGNQYHEKGGKLILEILDRALAEAGGRVLRPVCADLLEKDETGRVAAVLCHDSEGTLHRYQGRKAVILAAGDCGQNEEMLAVLCPTALKAGKNLSLNSGDGKKWRSGPVQS